MSERLCVARARTYAAPPFRSAVQVLILGLLVICSDIIIAVSQRAVISGRVVTGVADGRPVRRARVFLNRIDGPGGATEISDDDGRFAFVDLPAGRHRLGAEKPGFVRMNYGETRPGRPGSAIVIADGQRLTDLTLHMIPGGVITGTVFDQAGNVASEVEVFAFRTQMRSGERAVVGGDGAKTDDRGVYRIYGLTPGEYVVAARPEFQFGTGRARETTSADFARATAKPQMAAGTAADQRQSRHVGYSAVYYPGTPESANAAHVLVTAGQELSGVDISLQLRPLSSVAGRVTWPGSRPKGQRAALMIVPLTPLAVDFFEAHTAIEDDLTFAFGYVAPGRYAILAQTVTESKRERADADAPQVLSAVQEINVQGDDIEGLVLALQPGARLSGRIAVGGANATTRFDPARISLELRPATTRPTAIRPASTTAKPDGTFAIAGITPGAYRLFVRSRRADDPIASAALIDAVNALDTPVEFRAGAHFGDVVVTFAEQPTELSGVMQDRDGRAAPEHFIVVFSTNRDRWFRDSRHIQAVRPASDGRYLVRGLPPGEYHLAALTDIEEDEWFDASFLDQLVAAAIRITIVASEKKVRDIRIGR